jgi:hypothetical protein
VGVRRAAESVGEFLIDTVGEAVGEVILSLLACVLLGCLVLIAYLSWSASPRFTIAGAGLLSCFLAHGAWQTFRTPAELTVLMHVSSTATGLRSAIHPPL